MFLHFTSFPSRLLQVPGLAGIPFDPNDHPVPSDKTPWWRVIVDFYTGDSDSE
jgi:hypothetical protein